MPDSFEYWAISIAIWPCVKMASEINQPQSLTCSTFYIGLAESTCSALHSSGHTSPRHAPLATVQTEQFRLPRKGSLAGACSLGRRTNLGRRSKADYESTGKTQIPKPTHDERRLRPKRRQGGERRYRLRGIVKVTKARSCGQRGPVLPRQHVKVMRAWPCPRRSGLLFGR